jgi:hypothetical protein
MPHGDEPAGVEGAIIATTDRERPLRFSRRQHDNQIRYGFGGATMTLVTTAAALWRSEKAVSVSGSLHPQKASPVSERFVAPPMAAQLSFRPDALAASIARTVTLRSAPDRMLVQMARAAMVQVEYLIKDGPVFEVSPFITALADAERSGFAGRVGAGVADLLMNSLGYAWRDNAICLSGSFDPHADFIYGAGPVAPHGVVLTEAHGSFAQSVSESRIMGEARRKYLRQVRPHIASHCVHGDVIHGYSVAFGSNPSSLETYLHVAETKISKSKGGSSPPAVEPGSGRAGIVPTSLALASHRSNLLLMGATQVVAWIDWLRGAADRPADDSETTFFTIEISGRKFLAVAEYFLPHFRSRFWLDDLDFPHALLHWDEIGQWRQRGRPRLANLFAMDAWAAKAFLRALSEMIVGGLDQVPATLDLPSVEPLGLSIEVDRGSRDEDLRYPVAQFRDGLAFLSNLPRSLLVSSLHWSPQGGLD